MDLLKQYGFNAAEFEDLRQRYRSGRLSLETNLINYHNSRQVRLPRPGDTVELPGEESGESREGRQLLAEGKFGLILMNGGAATRFQKPGENLPKGAFEIMELAGRKRSFMELKLAHARWAEEEFGGSIPVWIMNSYFTADRTKAILRENNFFGKKDVFTYSQGIMKRIIPSAEDLRLHYGKVVDKLAAKIAALSPGEDRAAAEREKKAREESLAFWIDRYRGRAGEVVNAQRVEEIYNPPGHLDTTLWLILDPSRPLLKMLELGVEYLLVSNIDNLGATIHPGLLGLLRRREDQGIGILAEVSRKPPGQKGGSLARVYDPGIGKEWAQIIEEFAFPPEFDQERIPEFNNATYTISVSSLLDLFELDCDSLRDSSSQQLRQKVKQVTDRLPVYVAMKELRENEGDRELLRPVVQFERLKGDLTVLLPPLGVRTVDRFFPVKKREDIPLMVPRLREILRGKLVLS